jgi:hypothetical protein
MLKRSRLGHHLNRSGLFGVREWRVPVSRMSWLRVHARPGRRSVPSASMESSGNG